MSSDRHQSPFSIHHSSSPIHGPLSHCSIYPIIPHPTSHIPHRTSPLYRLLFRECSPPLPLLLLPPCAALAILAVVHGFSLLTSAWLEAAMHPHPHSHPHPSPFPPPPLHSPLPLVGGACMLAIAILLAMPVCVSEHINYAVCPTYSPSIASPH